MNGIASGSAAYSRRLHLYSARAMQATARSIRRKPTAECICEGSSVRPSALPTSPLPSPPPAPRPSSSSSSSSPPLNAPVSCRDSTADKTVASDAARIALTPRRIHFSYSRFAVSIDGRDPDFARSNGGGGGEGRRRRRAGGRRGGRGYRLPFETKFAFGQS